MADEFCKFFDWMMARYTLKNTGKRSCHRESTLSKAEIMLIIILFHDSGYRCFKHFYLDNVCKHLRHLFPKVVSYRFVELEKEVAIPLALFIKKVLLPPGTAPPSTPESPTLLLAPLPPLRLSIHQGTDHTAPGSARTSAVTWGPWSPWCLGSYIHPSEQLHTLGDTVQFGVLPTAHAEHILNFWLYLLEFSEMFF